MFIRSRLSIRSISREKITEIQMSHGRETLLVVIDLSVTLDANNKKTPMFELSVCNSKTLSCLRILSSFWCLVECYQEYRSAPLLYARISFCQHLTSNFYLPHAHVYNRAPYADDPIPSEQMCLCESKCL